MRRLAITLLGGIKITLEGQPVLGLGTGKLGALLAYLALEGGRVHARGALAELLWTDRPTAEALNSLRFAISNLRTALQDRDNHPPFLLVERAAIQLNPQAGVWVDVLEFQQRAETAIRLGSAAPPAELEGCLALYQGSFLHGFPLGDSLDFESWTLTRRDSLDRQHLQLQQMLAEALEGAGRHPQAEKIYRSILAAQPWDELTHRRLMRLLAETGQRHAALAQYGACRAALLEELGVEPEWETNQLYHHLKTQPGATPGVREPVSTPFVARKAELARLQNALARMLSGQGGVALITGEAGSGKTALLSEFARQALERHPQLLVAGGQCDAYNGLGQPFLPFTECLQMLLGEGEALPWTANLPGEARERLAEAAPGLARRLVESAPALLDRLVDRSRLPARLQPSPGTPAAPGTAAGRPAAPRRPERSSMPPLDRAALFEQFTRLLTGLAPQRPLLLVLDDLHWIDPDSAALLFHLVRRIAGSRVLLLAAYRAGDLAPRPGYGEHPLVVIQAELQRQGGDIRIDLDQADECAFVSALLQHDPQLNPHRLDDAFRSALVKHTGGNPLFTIEMLHSLQARGDLRRDAGGTWVSSPQLDWEYLPERVEAAIAGRMARLPAEWQDRLLTASVQGESFTLEALASVHRTTTETLQAELSAYHNRDGGLRRILRPEGVVQAGGQRLSIYHFRHSLYQTYLYQQLDPVERSRRHALLAEALEQLYGLGPAGAVQLDAATGPRPASEPPGSLTGRRAAELARHFEAAGIPEPAARYYLQAGEQLLVLSAAAAALAHFRRGIAVLSDAPRGPARDQLRIRLYLALSEPFLWPSGRGGRERQSAIQRVLILLEQAGMAPDEAVFSALQAQIDWLISHDEHRQAVHLSRRMAELGRPLGRPWLAVAHWNLGRSQVFSGDLLAGREHLEQALAGFSAAGIPAGLAGIPPVPAARSLLGCTLAYLGCSDQARRQSRQAVEQARRLHSTPGLGLALTIACETTVLLGDLTALQALADELLKLGTADELRIFRAYGLQFQGYTQVMTAEPGSPQAQAGLALMQQGYGLWESTGTRSARGLWQAHLAEVALQAGQIEAGLDGIRQALERSSGGGIGPPLAEIQRLQGEMLLQSGPPQPEQAEACFLQALETARRQSAHALELRAATSLARFWQPDRPGEARRLLQETCAWFTEGFETPSWRAAQALLADLAEA
ncbi:MAG: ATP-binding protein [Chloroflexota bacterium]